jgi:hypothetical protein
MGVHPLLFFRNESDEILHLAVHQQARIGLGEMELSARLVENPPRIRVRCKDLPRNHRANEHPG